MSKSAGGFTTVDTLIEKGYNPLVYRMFCLQSHYRNPLVFSFERLDGANSAYKKLLSKIETISPKDNEELQTDLINNHIQNFKSALENDLNTSLALTQVYEVLKDETLNNAGKLHIITEFDKVLGLNLINSQKNQLSNELEEYISSKITQRLEAKKNKNYALADQIRAELLEKGIVLKDTPTGTEYSFN